MCWFQQVHYSPLPAALCRTVEACLFVFVRFNRKSPATSVSLSPHGSSSSCRSITNQRFVVCSMLRFSSSRRRLVSLPNTTSNSIILAFSTMYLLNQTCLIFLQMNIRSTNPKLPTFIIPLESLADAGSTLSNSLTAAARERYERGDCRRGCARDLCKQQD